MSDFGYLADREFEAMKARALAAEAALARAEPLLAASLAHNKTVTYGNPGGEITPLVLASIAYARAASIVAYHPNITQAASPEPTP